MSLALSLSQLPRRPTRAAKPKAAVVIANTVCRPAMYPSITTGTCSGVNAKRICVAPVDRARAGSSSGRFSTKCLMSRLFKPHWAAEMKKEPPMVRQTGTVVVSVVLTQVHRHGSGTHN